MVEEKFSQVYFVHIRAERQWEEPLHEGEELTILPLDEGEGTTIETAAFSIENLEKFKLYQIMELGQSTEELGAVYLIKNPTNKPKTFIVFRRV